MSASSSPVPSPTQSSSQDPLLSTFAPGGITMKLRTNKIKEPNTDKVNVFVARDHLSMDNLTVLFIDILLYSLLGFVFAQSFCHNTRSELSLFMFMLCGLSIYQDMLSVQYITMSANYLGMGLDTHIVLNNKVWKQMAKSRETSMNQHLLVVRAATFFMNLVLFYALVGMSDKQWHNIYEQAPVLCSSICIYLIYNVILVSTYFMHTFIGFVWAVILTVTNMKAYSLVDNGINYQMFDTSCDDPFRLYKLFMTVVDFTKYENDVDSDDDVIVVPSTDQNDEDNDNMNDYDDVDSLEADEIAAQREGRAFNNYEPEPYVQPQDPVALSNHQLKFRDTLDEVRQRYSASPESDNTTSADVGATQSTTGSWWFSRSDNKKTK